MFTQVILEFLQEEFPSYNITIRNGQKMSFHLYNGDIIHVENNHSINSGWVIIGAHDDHMFVELFTVIRPDVSRYAQYSNSYELEYVNPEFLDTLQYLISEFFRKGEGSDLLRSYFIGSDIFSD